MVREASPQECSRTVGLIYPFLDRELDEASDDAVRAHLGVCALCRDLVAAEEEFLSLARTDMKHAPAPRFKLSDVEGAVDHADASRPVHAESCACDGNA